MILFFSLFDKFLFSIHSYLICYVEIEAPQTLPGSVHAEKPRRSDTALLLSPFLKIVGAEVRQFVPGLDASPNVHLHPQNLICPYAVSLWSKCEFQLLFRFQCLLFMHYGANTTESSNVGRRYSICDSYFQHVLITSYSQMTLCYWIQGLIVIIWMGVNFYTVSFDLWTCGIVIFIESFGFWKNSSMVEVSRIPLWYSDFETDFVPILPRKVRSWGYEDVSNESK